MLSVRESGSKRGAGVPEDQRPPQHRAPLWLLGALVMSVAAWFVFMRTVTPLDLDVFLSGGRAVAHGRNPYPALGSPQVWSGSAYVYPWITAWLFAPAAAISRHAATLAMAATSIGCVIGGVWSLAGRRLGPLSWVLLASPTIVGLQMGTLNAALFLGACLAWRWRDRPARVGVVIGVLVTLKVLCWPLVLWLLLTRRWRASAWAVGAGALLLGIGWVAGPFGPVSYARLLGELAQHEVIRSSGLQGLLVLWWMPVFAAQLVGLLAVAGVVAVVARRSDLTIYTGMIAAALLASPVVWHHYYLLAAAPLLLFRGGPRAYFLVGWAAVAPHPSYGLSWLPLTIVADVALGVVVVGLVWRHRAALSARRRRVPRAAWLAYSAASICLATALVFVGHVDRLVQGISQAVLPIWATLALIVAASVQRAHRDA